LERHDDNALIIYTDGSCLQRPRRGGFAYRLVTVDDAGRELTFDFSPPGHENATNNEMELMACIEALTHVLSPRAPVDRNSYEKIVIYTDSTYVLDGIYQAEFVWPTRNWMTREGEPVLSPDLWKDLVRRKQQAGRVEFRPVQAHKTNPHNKAVDKLAKESARLAGRSRLSARAVRRKTSPRKTEPRSVQMRGQVETIRILALKNLRGVPHHAYKYEVVCEESEDYQAVDDAYARDGQVEMRPGHVYHVRFSEPGSGRWMDEVLGEVDRN
jgi:ribonuclease HI